MIETIKHAAVKSKKGNVFIGKSHADCFSRMFDLGIKPSNRAKDQGFVTSEYRFVTRDIALLIAKRAGQVDDDIQAYLFSENLWSSQDGGRYKYSPIKGYYL